MAYDALWSDDSYFREIAFPSRCLPRIKNRFLTCHDNNPAAVRIMAWRRIGDKPLSEQMLARSTDAYVISTRGTWVVLITTGPSNIDCPYIRVRIYYILHASLFKWMLHQTLRCCAKQILGWQYIESENNYCISFLLIYDVYWRNRSPVKLLLILVCNSEINFYDRSS